ncbi:MAG: hypothetical protein LQ343_006746 [Gyalolechia ehrenbergii]|nr:MAG: hypothetical protein LQ343_006746 [Gyalolechia ehrenbergii]
MANGPIRCLVYDTILFIFFAPLLVPFLVLFLGPYYILGTIIPDDWIWLAVNTRIWRRGLRLLFIVAALLALAQVNGGEAPGWDPWIDKALWRYRRTIDKGCGWAGRRITNLELQRPPSRTSSPPCIPKFCPNTLSWIHYPNPYAILGFPTPSMLDPTDTRPTAQQILLRHRHIAAHYHPDRLYLSHLSYLDATRILIILQTAKETLLTPEKREEWEKEYFYGKTGGLMRGSDARQKSFLERWPASRTFTYLGGEYVLTFQGPELRGRDLTATTTTTPADTQTQACVEGTEGTERAEGEKSLLALAHLMLQWWYRWSRILGHWSWGSATWLWESILQLISSAIEHLRERSGLDVD